MQQLIKITEQNGNRAVSARELYEFLEVKTDFSDWCKRMFEYGFDENIDFSLLKIGERNAHNKIDYALTIDTAKEISMLQRTDKGKEARRYFIEMEKVATNQIEAPVINQNKVGVVALKKAELLKTIKINLFRGDMTEIAKDINVSLSVTQRVLENKKNSKKILEALFNKALENKKQLLFEYQEMIDILKN